MASEKKITMHEYNGTDYDTLYPKTIAEQVDGVYGKDEVLSNSTKALYGLTDSVVPDNVLALLSRFNKGLGNEYVWEKSKQEWVVSQAESATSIQANTQNTKKLRYSDSYTLGSDGSITLNNPVEVTPTTSNYASVPLAGKYFQEANWSTGVYETAVYYSNQNLVLNGPYVYAYGYLLSTTLDVVSYGYVNSPDPNAYPPAVSDGYTYTALGQLGAKTQIATGSYTGTGTYGSNNKCSITFDFEPEFIAISRVKPDNLTTMLAFFTCGCQVYTSFRSASSYAGGAMTLNACGYCTWGSNFSFYHTTGAEQQMNLSGIEYNYIAIG